MLSQLELTQPIVGGASCPAVYSSAFYPHAVGVMSRPTYKAPVALNPDEIGAGRQVATCIISTKKLSLIGSSSLL